ncbi:hypothetical protein HDG32_004684 [Paraburkholderia sp. CI2]|uniref:hypothetical protein n=1 Tax=unclassified Paraburkholderia TaxID=2615204 RepID=UPI001607B73A|nr:MULTISPECIES: hypothetical protein [unclassified Paraburkholderia]MBB5468554.1 hypothetical protein [Paraburkholderia sp. CI2]MBC8743024.1 hypothetical protein [Paraburkholderia sp. UCT31]
MARISFLPPKNPPNSIATQINLMRHSGEQLRLAASRQLLDRAVGRPALHADIKTEIETKAIQTRSIECD